jgi:hypothetical protein
VTLGFEEGDRVETLTGLVVGEQVIVAGQGGLKDGSPIKALAAAETPPAPEVAAARPGR